MNKNIGNIANYLAAVILLLFGCIYLFRSNFMPYHAEAVGLSWPEVAPNMQLLILALMRAAAGGYIATSVVLFILQYQFASTRATWIPGLILTTGFLVCFASIYATMIVRFNSPGKPPTLLAILGIALLLVGFVFNRKAATPA